MLSRTELEWLRDHLQRNIQGLTEILRKVQMELESTAPVENEPYDMEADLLQSEPHGD